MRGPSGKAEWPSHAAWKMAKLLWPFNAFASVMACRRTNSIIQYSANLSKQLRAWEWILWRVHIPAGITELAVLLGIKESCGEVDGRLAVGLLLVVVVHSGIRWSVMSGDSLHLSMELLNFFCINRGPLTFFFSLSAVLALAFMWHGTWSLSLLGPVAGFEIFLFMVRLME